MKLSKNLFQNRFSFPKNYSDKPTSSLLEDGIFCYFLENGVPFYMPLGQRIIARLKEVCSREASKMNIPEIDIPFVLSDEILEKGEVIGEQFKSKIFTLEEAMKGHHMITTPEPLIIELASRGLDSYKQLPLRQVYHVEVFRALDRPQGIMKGIQFKTFMGHALDLDLASLEDSARIFEELSDKIFTRLRIPTQKCRNLRGFDLEYFYRCAEGENIDLVGDDTAREAALSLAMTYHYNKTGRNWARFRNKQNKNSYPLYLTFGLGTQRVFYAVFNSSRDQFGFNLPAAVRPFNLAVIPVRESEVQRSANLVDNLTDENILFDERPDVLWGDKAKFADYLGIPYKIVVAEDNFLIKARGGAEIYSSKSAAETLEVANRLATKQLYAR